ncbi:adenosylcobinamide-phosphate synthase CbiB [Knoellia sp. S7-12]|uniref:adenosylcobinamide-phosphate synthase CbiB n=1 Tax=Knoellia sp. S7-12 TaxID=3126698 RepID=UPI0033669427
MTLGLVLGFLADQTFGDPRRGHPVAGFGQLASLAEKQLHAPSRTRGAVAVVALVTSTAGLGLLERRLPTPARAVLAAATTWAVLGGRSLAREGEAISALLEGDDVAGARLRIRNLVGRDPGSLDANGIARACVESIAENSADAVVAPLFLGAVAGVPGLLGYRAINTLDAMWGHRNERYREFGWAAARLDDVANWLPARLTVALNAALVSGTTAGLGGGVQVVRVVRRDAPAHPSPNAGPVEASWAAALGVRLGGTNHYDGVDEDRGHLGDGPPVTVADIPRATQHLSRLSTAALVALVSARVLVRGRRTS